MASKSKTMRILLVLFFGISLSLNGNYEVKQDFLEKHKEIQIKQNLQNTEKKNVDLLNEIESKLLHEYELVPKNVEESSDVVY